jgi:hypothetical protein
MNGQFIIISYFRSSFFARTKVINFSEGNKEVL